jgi:site-specific recombinase XerD
MKLSVTTFIDTKNAKTTIYFCINYNKKRVNIPCHRIELKKSDWEKGKFIEGRGKASNKHKQNELDLLKAELRKFVLDNLKKNGSLPAMASLKSFVNGEEEFHEIPVIPKQNASDINFLSFVSDIIQKRGFVESSVFRHSFANNTLKCYQRFYNCFSNFEQLRGKQVVFSDFECSQLIDEFRLYLVEKNYRLNTIGERLKNLKVFINEAVKVGRISLNPFARFGIKVPKEEIDAIALTEQELRELEQLDLTDEPRLSIIRDHYICMCFSGLRISDYLQFAKIDSIGEQTPIVNQKTKKISYIPTLPPVRRVLARYQNSLPEVFTEQHINRTIKEIVARIPSFQKIEHQLISFGYGSKRRDVPRFTLVTNHTARRTLVTILLRQGFTYEEVMAMTGHTDIRSIRSYNKMTNKEKVGRIQSQFIDPGA